VVFGTGEPTALASTLPGVLTLLRQVTGPDRPIMLGFDRGGAYPSAFTACRDAGADPPKTRHLLVPATSPQHPRKWNRRHPGRHPGRTDADSDEAGPPEDGPLEDGPLEDTASDAEVRAEVDTEVGYVDVEAGDV